ncbi:MAG: ATP-binding protein [Oscillospiraceae bacterium]|nr:ATP-binding protein [Oscillospiraceae bacterium]MBP1546664.1 ATP-binding protein [Oscillospiraceae bacterium]
MIYLMCGRICSGKSTHSQSLRKEKKAVVLSVDEITLALFGQDAGEKHDDYVAAAEEYLYRKSLEIAENGIDVILDWGFWTKEERDYAREFYGSRNIPFEFHYIDITPDEWQKRIDKRNADITSGKLQAYYVDEGLSKKFAEIFEKPDESEMKDFIIV